MIKRIIGGVLVASCSMIFSPCLFSQGNISSATGKNVSIEFANADIRSVLKVLAAKGEVNIVADPEVKGDITITLNNVPWEKALEIVLKTYGYGYEYEKEGDVFIVRKMDKIKDQRKTDEELISAMPLLTEVVQLKYIDAWDAKEVLDAQKSKRGQIVVLIAKGIPGWEFGGSDVTSASEKRKRKDQEDQANAEWVNTQQGTMTRTATTTGTAAVLEQAREYRQNVKSKNFKSKTLIITDTKPYLDKIKKTLEIIDVKPKQVLIQTRMIEVNRDYLKDLGLEYGTGSTGATSDTIYPTPIDRLNPDKVRASGGGHLRQYAITPAAFTPMATGLTPDNTGLTLMLKKLTGNQFQVVLHALEEKVKSNVLSAPSIVALNNQEASILVGTKFPILKSGTSTTGSTNVTTTAELDYYQDIGIQLNVVPQVSDGNAINMVIHPVVSTTSSSLKIKDTTSGKETGIEYPIIQTREAETQILMNHGETIVIGGLLKDRLTTSRQAIPFLGDMPYIGDLFFARRTSDVEKIDLLIFITAYIIEETVETAEVLREKSDVGKDEDVPNYVPNDLKKRDEAGEFILKR